MAWVRLKLALIVGSLLSTGCSGKSDDPAAAGSGGSSAGGSAGSSSGGGGGASGGSPSIPELEFYVTDAKPDTAVKSVFWGDPYAVRVTGLVPQASVTLSARADVIDQQELESSATFEVTADGSIDTGRDAPIAGSYSEVDSDGLVWSSAPAKDGENRLAMNQFEVRAEAGTVEIVRGTLDRYYLATNTVQLPVNENGLVGVYYAPKDGLQHPAIIAFGGSEGGLMSGEYQAAYWVSRGYAALGLAYFGETGLPALLEKIPLEYFDQAHSWLENRPDADASRVAVMGGSRGGELALLLGATFPWVKAVIAKLPSAVAWGAPEWSGPELASWTYQSKDLPFVPSIASAPTTSQDPDGTTLYHYRPTFEASIAAASPEILDQATARVENTQGPVLMIAGADDQLWPACDLSAFAQKRLESSGHAAKYSDALLCLPEAGHNIGSPGSSTLEAHRVLHPVTHEWLALGGTPAGIAHAARQADSKIKSLLEQALK